MPIYTKPGQETITKAPPIDFLSTGESLTAWSIYGNGQQTGTPTPSAPIQPEFVGVRTANLWVENASYTPGDGVSIERKNDGLYFSGQCTRSNLFITYCDITPGDYTLSANANRSPYDSNVLLQIYKEGVINKQITNADAVSGTQSFTVTEAIEGVQLRIRIQQGADYDGFILRPMLNTGTTALPYEPYGYKIPITTSQTVPVYLGQTVTTRRVRKLVLTGEETIAYQPGYSRFRITISDIVSLGIRATPFYTTHYKVISDESEAVDNSAYTGGVGDPYIFIKDLAYTSSDDFKSYLAAQYQAGVPVTVWYVLAEPETAIVNEPLCKIGDHADELHSADAQITIPTTAGHNTLTVDTTLQPSSVSITAPDIYHQVDRIMCNVNGTQTEIAKVVDNQNNLIFTPKNWFGFKIDTTNDDSSTAVTYTHSAVTMTPAFMDYTNGVFNYGSWKNVWFIKNSYPVALNFDGTEAYKLDPDDYTKRLDGTPSDIQYVLQTEEPSNWSTQWKQYYTKSGDDYVMNSQSEAPTWAADTYYTLTCLSSTVNFMLAFPKVYFRRYTDSQYNHVEIADRKIDNNWYAYAHVNTNGVEVDYIYLPLFKGSIVDSKLRSIPGVIPTGSTTASTEVNAATALGSRWQIWDHSSRELINDLLILMSKSIDCQTAFGRGRESGYNADDTVTYGKLPTGTAIRKGPFYGSSTSLSEVKVFGMESFWANRWDRLQGILLVDNVWKIKMTPPYNFTGTDFTTLTQFDVPSGSGYLSKVAASQYGSIPASISGGASNKFYRDYFYKSDTGTRVGLVGGACGNGAFSGFRFVSVSGAATGSGWHFGASPVYK